MVDGVIIACLAIAYTFAIFNLYRFNVLSMSYSFLTPLLVNNPTGLLK